MFTSSRSSAGTREKSRRQRSRKREPLGHETALHRGLLEVRIQALQILHRRQLLAAACDGRAPRS